jgi:hypothetical protein
MSVHFHPFSTFQKHGFHKSQSITDWKKYCFMLLASAPNRALEQFYTVLRCAEPLIRGFVPKGPDWSSWSSASFAVS